MRSREIIELIKRQIESGELSPDARVPSTAELVAAYRVSDSTAKVVLRALEAEGYVRSVKGSGTYVLGRDTIDLRIPVDGMRLRGELYTDADQIFIISAELVETPPHVARILGVEVGSEAVRREGNVSRTPDSTSGGARRMLRLSYSWYPLEFAELVPELLLTEHPGPGSLALIKAATGREENAVLDAYSPRALGPLKASRLGVKTGSLALVRETTRRDDLGVLEYGETFWPHGIRVVHDHTKPDAEE